MSTDNTKITEERFNRILKLQKYRSDIKSTIASGNAGIGYKSIGFSFIYPYPPVVNFLTNELVRINEELRELGYVD